jgi:hypothetical protein
MKSRTVMQVLDAPQVKPGETYVLKQLPCGVLFIHGGTSYRTVTHPPVWTGTRPGCKRDCWNETDQRMDLIDYNTDVRVA